MRARTLWIALPLALLLAAGGIVGVAQWLGRKASEGSAAIGGPFALVDGQGRTVTDHDFRGRFMLVYFGYTHCPDACPTTLNDLAVAIGKLSKSEQPEIVPIFITVDPARDTPTVMRDYVRAFGPEFVGLTGAAPAIAKVEQEYHVYAERRPLAHGDYAMDHSAFIYVMGPGGGYRTILPDADTPAEMAQKLRAILRG